MNTKTRTITTFNVTFEDGTQGRHVISDDWSVIDAIHIIEHRAKLSIVRIDSITCDDSRFTCIND